MVAVVGVGVGVQGLCEMIFYKIFMMNNEWKILCKVNLYIFSNFA